MLSKQNPAFTRAKLLLICCAFLLQGAWAAFSGSGFFAEDSLAGNPDPADPPNGDDPTLVYHHHDLLGSVVALSNKDAEAVEYVRYTSFGKATIYNADLTPTATNTSNYSNRHLYTGREHLREVNLNDHRNRYYSPHLARWTTTDPIQFSAGDINLYRYVGNGVTGLVDLMGLEEMEPIEPVPVEVEISDRAIEFIISCEINGCQLPLNTDYYERHLADPSWPGEQSGVTIGIGFDLGYNTRTEIHDAWAGVLDEDDISTLVEFAGITGTAARDALRASEAARCISIPYDDAATVFKETTLPRFVNQTRGLFRTDILNGDQFGALVSLVFNRGSSINGDRRREMRQIRELLRAGNIDGVPRQIRAMTRLWPDSRGLRLRREQEALLFEGSL